MCTYANLIFCQVGITYYTEDSIKVYRKFQYEAEYNTSQISKCDRLKRVNNDLFFEKDSGELVKMEGIDINSLIVFENNVLLQLIGPNACYFKDKQSVYCFDKRIECADYPTFIVLENGFSKDINHVYFYGEIFQEADPESFKCLSLEYSQDKNHFYHGTTKLSEEEAIHLSRLIKYYHDVSSYVLYTIGDGEVFYNGYKMDCDYESFKSLDNGYAKDKYHVYYSGVIINGADAKSFERTGHRDEKKICRRYEIINNYMHSPFAKDKKRFYLSGEPLIRNKNKKTIGNTQ
jgi:hypothetical protein